MATASTSSVTDNNNNNRQPHPTITYPSVHLDSFSPEKFPRGGNGEDRLSQGSGSAGLNVMSMSQQPAHLQQRPSSSASGQSTSTPRPQNQDSAPRQANGGLMQQASSSSSSLPRPPPAHPPPSLGLPPLPTLSPISPMYALPPDPNVGETSFSSTPVSSPPAGPRVQGPRLAPSLSIHIPGSPKPARSVPPLKDSPSMARRRTLVEHEGFQGVPLDVESSRNHSRDTPRRLEKKASTNDLRQQPSSPSSPTTRRSLPRPPGEMTVPTTSTTWPVPNMPTRALAPQHQPQKSASILPIVGGLADAGPYAATATPRQSTIGAGVGGPSGMGNLGVGRPPVSAKLPTRVPPQEEVCLECMMRDRDLADVTVIGPGAWSRQSDADWDELRWREEALLKSMGSQSSLSVPSLEEAGSSDSEDTSVSLVSTGNSVEDSENRRKIAIMKHQRSLLRAKRREADGRVVREVGWKGFIWEEGKQGEGMPKGFRGTVGGKLTEGGIKAVMTKYPKASEHRYEYLHKYLQHQWKLVMDIRAEAQRHGHYPIPNEVAYNDSISSHEQIAAGPRTSSISWDRQSTRESRDLVRDPMVTTGVRPSPSTPTELAAARPKPSIVTRPHTQLLPSEVAAAADQRMTPTPHSARSRYEKGISSPGTLERSPQPDRWGDDDDDQLWSPVSAGDGSLRPFSFAVRAGAAAARDGNHGNDGRKSLWGRWGGSVTSFFGGSQGGSGSMMDMHLGLDNDRRNANLPQGHNNYSRAVSMASPSRPSFFSRDSRASVDHARDPRALSKSISSSRLSQVVRNEDEGPKKKKGLKGLIQKMKPKSKRQSTSPVPPNGHYTPDHHNEVGTPLAPPPNMAYLAGQGQQRHSRNGSSSSIGDSQGSSWKMRSVSAPIGGSSSGSLSASPTSSKFNRRESYNSAQQRGYGGENDGEMQRGSIVEVLHGNQQQQYQQQQQQQQQGQYPRTMYASPEPTHGQMYDDHRASISTGGQQGSNSYPNPSFRGARQTAGSISNSSGIAPTIETPPMPLTQGPFFSRPPSLHSPATGTSNGFSPNPNNANGANGVNRFKNLPPLPPPGPGTDRDRVAPSPDSFQVFDQQQQQQQQQSWNQQPQGYQPGTPDFTKSPPRGYNPYQQTPPPRASYDRPMSTPRAEASPRMAQSMYVQPTASTGSFARFTTPNGSTHGNGGGGGVGGSPYRPPSHGEMYGQPPHPHSHNQGGRGNVGGNGNGFVENDKRSIMSKKGLKGFFGGAKNGRMA